MWVVSTYIPHEVPSAMAKRVTFSPSPRRDALWSHENTQKREYSGKHTTLGEWGPSYLIR
jgi:hypothetical protein